MAMLLNGARLKLGRERANVLPVPASSMPQGMELADVLPVLASSTTVPT